MKGFLFILIAIGLIYGCTYSTKSKPVDNNPIQKNIQDPEPKRGEETYWEIKKQFDQGFYIDLDRLIYQFYEFHKESLFLDSIRIIDNELKANRRNIKYLRDSLSKLSLTEYLRGINLPRLDSITDINYEVIKHHYTLDFTDFDEKMFQTNWDENWYLSRQLSVNSVCVTICHFRDCENSVVLYSLDSNRNIIDSKELYDNGCYGEPAPDFRYQKYLVNEKKRFNATYFHGDTSFTRIIRTYFTLLDTTTNKTSIEIGNEYNVTYNIDSLGKFKVIKDKGFKKEYVEPLYKVPI